MFHPTGINLLDQTSVLGLTVPLIPVTWLFGPVASFNVASTIVPALSALTTFVVLRRWVHWPPAAYIGGLLYGFSPFVLASLEYGHLMTAALMLLPLLLAVLDEILVRQRHSARRAGAVSYTHLDVYKRQALLRPVRPGPVRDRPERPDHRARPARAPAGPGRCV